MCPRHVEPPLVSLCAARSTLARIRACELSLLGIASLTLAGLGLAAARALLPALVRAWS